MHLGGFNAITDTRYGPMFYNRHDRYVGRSLEVYGECCELELQLLRQVCPDGGTVFDVGANIGVHTIALSQHVGERGFVYAFEPQRVLNQTLAGNCALRSLLNVECVHAAVGTTNDALVIPDIDYNADANYGGISPRQFRSGRPVRQVRLDDYLWLPRVDLVKIDIEGMEIEALSGGRDFIARFRPILYVENDRLDRSAALIQTIAEFGYLQYWHVAPLFNIHNFRNLSENVFPGIAAANMLCIPQDRAVTVEGLPEIGDVSHHPFAQP